MNTTELRPFSQIWPGVAFVTVLFFCNYMARSTISPLLAYMEIDLGISHSQSTSFIFAQGIGFACTQLCTGYLVSFIKPRVVASLSIIGHGICFLLIPLLQDFYSLWILFFCFGMICGVYLASGIAILGTLVRTKDWGKAIGIHELGPNLGFIVIPVLANIILIFGTWHTVFATVGAFSVLVGISFLLWGQGGHAYSEKPSIKSNISLFKQLNTWIFCLLIAIGMCGEFSIFSILQIFLVGEQNFSPERANNWLFLSRLATPVFVIIGGLMADRFSASKVILAGFFTHALALFLMAFGTYQAIVLTGVAIQPLCIAFLFPSVFKLIGIHIPVLRQPALLSMIMPLAALISVGFMPWILGISGQHASFGHGFVLVAVLSLLCVFSLFFVRSTPDASKEDA